MQNREDAATVAWVRDWLQQQRDAKRSWRAIAEQLRLRHPYLMDVLKNPREQLGPDLEAAVAREFFGGSKDKFRSEAMAKFGSKLVMLPRFKGGPEPQRYTATPEALGAAILILTTERDVKSAASVVAIAPFVFFSSPEDAANVRLVVEALYDAIKGRGSRGDEREPDRGPPALPLRSR